MNYIKKPWALLVVGALLCAPSLQAAMSITLLQDLNSYSSGGGGEFRGVVSADVLPLINLNAYAASTKGIVTVGNSGAANGYNSGLNGLTFFQSFCIEEQEKIAPGTPYVVTGTSRNAMYGGQPPLGDPISIGTAYLYSQFAAGTLSGYDYSLVSGSTRTTSAGQLQAAIWWLESEIGGAKPAYVNVAEDALYGAHGAAQDLLIVGNANGAFGVLAMNIGAPGVVQDQLVITAIPEASTVIAGVLLLLPLGASALRILRKDGSASQK